ncbi:hypothetical protein KC926_03935 [Candidatus Kaiserbacteria bacterium]|nr:hypothetical protein [Candidatus Kaiserbacteria bacterium]
MSQEDGEVTQADVEAENEKTSMRLATGQNDKSKKASNGDFEVVPKGSDFKVKKA